MFARCPMLVVDVFRYVKRRGRGLSRSRSGVAAVEFALIAAPFFALLFAIIETGLVCFSQEVLQTAVTQSARLIMTEQAQAQGMTAAQFQQDVCARAGVLFDCSNLSVNVQTFSSFSGVSMLNPVQNGNFQSSNMSFQPGAPGDIVLVQAFYQVPVVTAPLNFDLANIGGGKRLIVASAAFRNEPN